MNEKNGIGRRSFLKAGVVAGGALLVGFRVPTLAEAKGLRAVDGASGGDLEPNAFIKLGADGHLTVRIGQAEMGQGVLTSLAMIVAEELEVDWANVSYEEVGSDPAFRNPLIGFQVTGGSTTIRGFHDPMRKAAASVREMLIAAAEAEWGMAPGSCRAESGKIIDSKSGRSAPYSALFKRAAGMEPPKAPKLKPSRDFNLIGKGVKRLDTPVKTDGSATYGMDISIPGMLVGQILRCPVYGGKVGKIDDTAAKAVKGVKAVVPLGYGVGIVADNFWAARQGRRALKVEWESGPNADVTSDSIYKMYSDAAANGKGIEARKTGDVAAARSGAVKTIEAEYFLPYLAHSTMEPLNCTADVRADGCDVYCGTQSQALVQRTAAGITGLPPAKIKVHNVFLGGGFGRRSEVDYIADAVLISKAVKKPVKLIWTREDDTQHDVYRPASFNRFSAGIDASGNPVFWQHRIVNSSIMARVAKALGFPQGKLDGSSVEGASNIAYEIPNIYVDWVQKEPGVPVGFWRSVGNSHNAFAVECFMDELASAAGKDPYEYRMSLLKKDKRKSAVLKLAAEKAGWGKPLPKGVGRGIAICESFGSIVAQVAEVSVSAGGRVKVHRVVCAVDCGQVVNPDTVAAQMEGGIVYGLTAALYGEIEIANGGAKQRNFNTYKMLRMREMPKVEVHIVDSAEKHGGVGEPGTPPIAPAVANAVFAAAGKRIRRLPIDMKA